MALAPHPLLRNNTCTFLNKDKQFFPQKNKHHICNLFCLGCLDVDFLLNVICLYVTGNNFKMLQDNLSRDKINFYRIGAFPV